MPALVPASVPAPVQALAPSTDRAPALAAMPVATDIHVVDIEAAINWWLAREAGDGLALPAAVRPLADVYALMIHQGKDRWPADLLTDAALQAWMAWYETTPDAPCIAICSTSQGDTVCKGCGRRFDEVQHWIAMDPLTKRDIWRRITVEGTAWRFQRYADRARLVDGTGGDPA